ncbi:hypothetical protein C8R45DRAFT_918071 [Mycena sanguinolenta]|nr:hypothetical protein C8R45DRAFT_918071 [Mycena sanguinolenta]
MRMLRRGARNAGCGTAPLAISSVSPAKEIDARLSSVTCPCIELDKRFGANLTWWSWRSLSSTSGLGRLLPNNILLPQGVSIRRYSSLTSRWRLLRCLKIFRARLSTSGFQTTVDFKYIPEYRYSTARIVGYLYIPATTREGGRDREQRDREKGGQEREREREPHNWRVQACARIAGKGDRRQHGGRGGFSSSRLQMPGQQLSRIKMWVNGGQARNR